MRATVGIVEAHRARHVLLNSEGRFYRIGADSRWGEAIEAIGHGLPMGSAADVVHVAAHTGWGIPAVASLTCRRALNALEGKERVAGVLPDFFRLHTEQVNLFAVGKRRLDVIRIAFFR